MGRRSGKGRFDKNAGEYDHVYGGVLRQPTKCSPEKVSQYKSTEVMGLHCGHEFSDFSTFCEDHSELGCGHLLDDLFAGEVVDRSKLPEEWKLSQVKTHVHEVGTYLSL